MNFNWKPLALSVREKTSTLMSASKTSLDIGCGTTGPIMSVRSIPLSILGPRQSLRQSDPQNRPRRFQLLGPHRAIGIAQAPKQLGIAEKLRGQVVQTLALFDGVLLGGGGSVRRRNETAADVDDRLAGRPEGRRVDTAIAAVEREETGFQPRELQQRLHVRRCHQIFSRPSAPRLPV